MKAYGSVAPHPLSSIDTGPPLPTATRSGRDVFTDITSAHHRRAIQSPIILQPLTVEATTALEERATRPPKRTRPKQHRVPGTRTPRAPQPREPRVDVAAIITLYTSGLTAPYVATHLGCAHTTVYSHLRAAGVERRNDRATGPTAPPRTPAAPRVDVSAILAAYQAGEDPPQISRRLGYASSTIHRYLTASGIPKRERTTRPRTPRRVTPREPTLDITAVLAAYEEGQTPPQIAARFDTYPKTIRSHLRAAGISMRDDRAGHSGSSKKVDPPALVDRMRELYTDQGHTIAEVAAILNTSAKVIQTALVRNNIARRRAVVRIGTDNAAGLKALMAEGGIKAADVRGWAADLGYRCAPVGIPSAHLVQGYQLMLAGQVAS